MEIEEDQEGWEDRLTSLTTERDQTSLILPFAGRNAAPKRLARGVLTTDCDKVGAAGQLRASADTLAKLWGRSHHLIWARDHRWWRRASSALVFTCDAEEREPKQEGGERANSTQFKGALYHIEPKSD